VLADKIDAAGSAIDFRACVSQVIEGSGHYNQCVSSASRSLSSSIIF